MQVLRPHLSKSSQGYTHERRLLCVQLIGALAAQLTLRQGS